MSVSESIELDRNSKRCTRCGKVKKWRQYDAAQKRSDGTMRYPMSRCKACKRELNRQAPGRRKRSEPEVYLDPAPFGEWVGSLGSCDRDISRILLTDISWVQKVRNGSLSESVSLTLVDKYLQRAFERSGSEARVGDLYPDL